MDHAKKDDNPYKSQMMLKIEYMDWAMKENITKKLNKTEQKKKT